MHKEQKTCQEASISTTRCIYCGNVAAIVWVHGHGQCAGCGTNIEECCRGENCTAGIYPVK